MPDEIADSDRPKWTTSETKTTHSIVMKQRDELRP